MSCALCCSILSLFGVGMMIMIGMLVRSGSPFIGKNSVGKSPEEQLAASTACFTAAGLYVLTFACSVYSLQRGGDEKSAQRR
mgnify:CR=1 FL=1